MLIGILNSNVDKKRIQSEKEPIFCIKTISNNGEKVVYFGIGYKVIRYTKNTPSEPFKNNIGVKIGSWFMEYNL